MSDISQFADSVTDAFAFLVNEYEFRVTRPKSGSTLNPVHYERPPMYVDIGWYKGEVDVRVGVTIDTSILRPYRPKGFDLWRIAVHLNPHALDERPALSQVAESVVEADALARYNAELMKAYCDDLLRGDLKVLEEITLKDENEKRA